MSRNAKYKPSGNLASRCLVSLVETSRVLSVLAVMLLDTMPIEATATNIIEYSDHHILS